MFSFIERHHLLNPGERVVAGVSGGADSVCLLFVLVRWAREYGLTIHVVHVNHGIRAEAGEDAAYVEGLCKKLGVSFTLVERDVRGEAAREKRSEEEMGRLVRYEAFRQAARQFGASKIAVAHNMDDQAETVLFHLFRGSGMTGLGGVRPRRDDIVRPLLCLKRQEVEDYLKQKGIGYRKDLTNDGDDYARNRIRHHILPYAEGQVCHGAASHISQAAQMLQEAEDYLCGQAEEAAARTASAWDCGWRVSVPGFLSLHPVIGKRMILTLLQKVSVTGRDLAASHVEAVAALFGRQGNASLSLPGQVRARKEYGWVFLERASLDAPEEGGKRGGQGEGVLPISISLEGLDGEEKLVALPGGAALGLRAFPYKKSEIIPKNQYTKWFDCDKINKILVIRRRQSGDFLSIRGGNGIVRKSLKQYFIDEKVPRDRRDEVFVLAEEGHVLWAVGYRIGEYYKVSDETRRILQVRFQQDP